MNPKKLMKSFILFQDMIKVFTNYADKLDSYFNISDNIIKHNELYDYYLDLKKDLKAIRDGFGK